MLYSSCKSPLLEIVERQLQMDVIRKVGRAVSAYGCCSSLPFIPMLSSVVSWLTQEST